MATVTAPQQGEHINYALTLSSREKFVILIGVLITLFLAALDNTIVSTAQPAIVAKFQGIDLISWVTSGYLLANTAMVPILGKLSDLYGRKVVMMTGTVLFLLGSALCGTAGSMMQLILYRVVQGIGAAGIFSMAFAIIADLWVPAERARISGFISSVFGLAGVVGPFAGGWLTDHISWRAVFYVNVPIGLIALIFVALKMPRLANGVKAPIDWLGTIFLLVTVVPLLLALTLDKDTYGWTSPTVLGLFALAAVGLVAFLITESRVASPVIPLKLFKNKTFALTAVGSLLFGGAFFGGVIYLAIFLVGVLGVSATKAGSTLMPMMLSLVVGSVVSSILSQRTGRYKPFVLAGFALTVVGLFLLSTMGPDTTLGGVSWRMVLLGLGVGPVLPMLALAITNAVPLHQAGVATSSRTFFQNIGQTLAVSIFGVILTTTLTTQMTDRMQPIVTSLPPQFQGQFDPNQLKSQLSGADGNSVDVSATITAKITDAFAAQRTLLTKAIKDNDPAAQDAIQRNRLLPAQLKQIAAPGAVEARAQQGMDALYVKIEAAVKGGNAQALAAIAADPQTPEALRQGLAQIPPAALQNPQAAAGILAQVQAGMAAGKPAAVAAAREKALAGALAGLDQAQQSALQQGQDTGVKITGAIKESFAAATTPIYFYASLVGVVGLLLMLFLPELELKKGHEIPVAME